MASKKSFANSNPIDSFITKPAEAIPSESPAADVAHFDSSRTKDDLRRRTETKSKRINLLVAPSVADRLKAAADREQASMNEVMNAALLSWLDAHDM